MRAKDIPHKCVQRESSKISIETDIWALLTEFWPLSEFYRKLP